MSEKISILLVDDDSDFLFQHKYELEQEGYEVTMAGSRKEAKEVLEQLKPDVAIVDLMMENNDSGFVLSYDIKRKYPEVPVIMVTAVTSKTGMEFNSITEDEKHWIKADTIFTKPVRVEQLIKEIKKLLRK